MSVIINENSLTNGEIDVFARPSGATIGLSDGDIEYQTSTQIAESEITTTQLADIIGHLTDKPAKRQSSRMSAAKRIFKLLETFDPVTGYDKPANNGNQEIDGDLDADEENAKDEAEAAEENAKPVKPKKAKKGYVDHTSEADFENASKEFAGCKLTDNGYPTMRSKYVRVQLTAERDDFAAIAGECQVLYPNVKTQVNHIQWYGKAGSVTR